MAVVSAAPDSFAVNLLARDSIGELAGVAAGTVAVGAVAVWGATESKHTAPILTFVGVLLVALLTTYTAIRGRQAEGDRQRERLDEERARLKLQLDEERERLRLQLAHEREKSDLDHVRGLLDDAAVALHEAIQIRGELTLPRLRGELRAVVQRLRQMRDDVTEDQNDSVRSESGDEKLLAAIRRAREVAADLARLAERLAIRLRPDHDAVRELRVANEALASMPFFAEVFEPALNKLFDETTAKFDDARAAFLAAASKTARVRIPGDAPND